MSKLFELLVKITMSLASGLIPPDDADPKHIFRYRLSISSGLALVAALVGVHIALACGFLPELFPGFANAAEVTKQQAQIVMVLMQQLDTEIFDTRERQCKTKSDEAKLLYTQRLQEKLTRYEQLTGHGYRVPDCGEF